MTRHRWSRALAAALLLAVAGGNAPGGEAPQPAADQKPVPDDARIEELMRLHHIEEESVRLVLVPTTVEDRQGRVVRDLSKSDFKVLEDKVPQKIAYFDREADEPVSVAFLLDLSGSMRIMGKLEAAKDAIRTFVEGLRPKDRCGLVGFADEQVAWITPFTNDRKRFLERLAVQEGFGQTALHDAVAAAPSLVDQDATGRKVIVLFTDGVDTRSHLTADQAIAQARHVHVPIYTVGLTLLPQMILDDKKEVAALDLKVLERISMETGGLLYLVNDPDDLKEAIADMADTLRFQYVLGYYPAREQWDGAFRRIQVETGRGRLIVRARTGYYATP
jgi:Ca-activated chloride channel family protein